jgi:shikimate kinase
MKIFLIGLPGCGKSTLGKQLAEKLTITFFDLDAEIEKSIGLPVKAIFKRYGESFFRKEESESLQRLSEGPASFVMATGGGTPVFFDNMNYMNKKGVTIFLDVPATEIANRILKTALEERPLFAGVHPEELKDQIEFLRSQRIPFYRQAQVTLTGEMIPLDEIVKAINKN